MGPATTRARRWKEPWSRPSWKTFSPDFSTTGLLLAKEPDAPAMHVLPPPDRKQGQGGGGRVMLGGAQGEEIAHQTCPW